MPGDADADANGGGGGGVCCRDDASSTSRNPLLAADICNHPDPDDDRLDEVSADDRQSQETELAVYRYNARARSRGRKRPQVAASSSSMIRDEESVISVEPSCVADEQQQQQQQQSQSRDHAALADELASMVANRSRSALSRLGSVHGLAALLGSRVDTGLDDDPRVIEEQRARFGANTYARRPAKGFLRFVLDAARDPTLLVLSACAVLSLAFGIRADGAAEGWYDGASILLAVLLVVLVTSASDYRQSLQFRALDAEKRRGASARAVRGGRPAAVPAEELVAGDVVALAIGDVVPADGVLVEGHSLEVDESAMTGESEAVRVGAAMPFLAAGCKVEDGRGTMLVTAVGMRTEWGKLMARVAGDPTDGDGGMGGETPLQARLNSIATFVGQIGLSVALLVLVILLAFYFTGHEPAIGGGGGSGYFVPGTTPASAALDAVVGILAVAVTLVVVAVPEGLPLAVTLSLAYAMRRMTADRALVRRLAACETMGGATAICTDKTGTLTLSTMAVAKVCAGGDGGGFRVWMADEWAGPALAQPLRSLLLEGIAHNSACIVSLGRDDDDDDKKKKKKPEVSGSATERAVLLWGIESLGLDFHGERSRAAVLQVETFSSAKKRAGVALRPAAGGAVRVHWKGAAEMLLADSDAVMEPDGGDGGGGGSVRIAIDAERRSELERCIHAMASESLRCIAFGYMELDPEEEEVPPAGEQLDAWKLPEGPLTLLAIVGMRDPCRPGVAGAVARCQAAGIAVRMITGDNPATAAAVAAECGILTHRGSHDAVVDGPTFRGLSDAEREARLPGICVMARSSPSDKLLMVLALRRMGEVVAVTGDGTNDAPALRAADVGLAMGLQGTEVAKESSDIIILDDNFATVARVVAWGRSIHANIQKFIQFQLTVNVAALAVNFVAAVASGSVPLTAVQLLWVNLIMDTLGALALATEPPSDELLDRPPARRSDPLVTNVMLRNLLLQSAYQIAVLLVLQFRGRRLLRLLRLADAPAVNRTLIFNSFVFCQLFNEVNARQPHRLDIFRGLLRNRLFLGIVASTAALQVVIVEFLNKFASTVKLGWQLWLLSVGIGFMSWPLALLGKLIPVPKTPLLSSRVPRFKPCCCSRRRR